MKLPIPLVFDWDKGNQEKNWIKHKVSHKECEEFFLNNPENVFIDEGHSDKEERFIAFLHTDKGRNLAIVFVIRENKIRIISARDQNKKERKKYEKV